MERAVIVAKAIVVAKNTREPVVAPRESAARKCSVGNGPLAMSQYASKLPLGNAHVSAARDILNSKQFNPQAFDTPSSNKLTLNLFGSTHESLTWRSAIARFNRFRESEFADSGTDTHCFWTDTHCWYEEFLT